MEIMLILLIAILLLDLYVMTKLVHAFRLLKISDTASHINEIDLPSVSVCIPARNETHAMTQCLERVVASDYLKLEVIVLDDGSRDDTSLLIKSFAHAGVRFVEGKPLPDGWLGKNYAQSILADEASGKFILFMDVDTLIEHHTISQLVNQMLDSKLQMLSVIPTRNETWQTSSLLAPMRYFWAMVRHTNSRPRAVSNAWLVERQFLLDQLKADATLQLSMLFETCLARKLVDEHKYRLVLSNKSLGLRYEKKWSSQVETSIRVLYPQCDAYTLQVVWSVLLLALTLVPYIAVFWHPWAIVLIVLQYVIAYYYLSSIWVRYRWIGALVLPATIAQEIWLLLLSTYQYKRGTVTWKGRPIQTPKA